MLQLAQALISFQLFANISCITFVHVESKYLNWRYPQSKFIFLTLE